MNRLILWTVGGVALLSAAYLGFVKLAFDAGPPPEPAAVSAPAAPPTSYAELVRPEATPSANAAAAPSPARRTEPAQRTEPTAPSPEPVADSTAADTAAVRRLTVELAERTRRAAHVGKPVARHVARDVLALGEDGCTTTDGVRLCLVDHPVGGWQVVGAAGGFAVTARGPATLGDAVAVSTSAD